MFGGDGAGRVGGEEEKEEEEEEQKGGRERAKRGVIVGFREGKQQMLWKTLWESERLHPRWWWWGWMVIRAVGSLFEVGSCVGFWDGGGGDDEDDEDEAEADSVEGVSGLLWAGAIDAKLGW